MHGHGIFISSDKTRYEGKFAKGKKDGFGVYFWTNGRIFEGWWVDGK
jgi:L1 cell adhesion molecule like protein